MRAAWCSAAGKIISRHTSRVRLVRSTLVVEVEDSIWQCQLHSLRRQILEQVRKTTGNTGIENLEFRIAVLRRQAQRARSANEGSGSPVQTTAKATEPWLPKPSTAARSAQPTLWSGEPGPDESDQIQDPVLKKVYQLSRRKASA